MAPALPDLPPPAPLPALPELPARPLGEAAPAEEKKPLLLAQATPLVTLAEDQLEIGGAVRFQTGKAQLDASSFALLEQVAAVLQQHRELALVEVQGHTDNQGPAAKNLQLSQARAEAVVRFLASKGIDPRRLRARGYGADRPIKPNLNKRNRDLNRRVEFHILERGAPAANPG